MRYERIRNAHWYGVEDKISIALGRREVLVTDS